jgi:hypothetical protein
MIAHRYHQLLSRALQFFLLVTIGTSFNQSLHSQSAKPTQTPAPAATAAPAPKNPAPGNPVRFTDIRKQAGITFLQDSTQTEEKY